MTTAWKARPRDAWQPIATLPEGASQGTDIVLFNPCDGMHPLGFFLAEGELDRIRSGSEGFTHWQRLDPPLPRDIAEARRYLKTGRIGPNKFRDIVRAHDD